MVQYGLPLAETVPLLAALLSLPLPADYAPERVAGAAEAADPACPPDDPAAAAVQQLCSSSWKTCTGSIRPRWSFSASWLIKAPPPASWRSSPFAGLQPALDGACPSHPGHGQPVAPTTGGGGDPPGGAQ